MTLPHPPLPRGQHLPAALLSPLSPRRWIALINVLLMVADFYTVIFGKQLDTGLLPRHRLRLLLMKSHHHLLQDLLLSFSAAFSQDFLTLTRSPEQNNALLVALLCLY